MTATLVRAVKGLQPCDAVLAFEWVDDDTAVVHATDVAELAGTVVSLRQSVVAEGGNAVVIRERLHRFISTATLIKLPWAPAAAAAIRVPATADMPACGLLLLWRPPTNAPHSLQDVHAPLAELTRVMLADRRRSESIDLLAHVMGAVPDALAFLSLDSEGSTVNASAAALLGVPEGRVAGPLLAQQMRALGRRVVNRDAHETLAQQLAGAGGSVLDVLWELEGLRARMLRVSMLDATKGSHRGWLWIFRDVTREELALRAAREQEQERERVRGFLESMLEAMDDNVIACDANGALFLMNAAARRRCGLRDEDATGEPFTAFVASLRTADGQALAVDETPLMRALHGEHVDDVELRLLTQEQRLLDMEISARPVQRADGALLGAVAIGRDVTQRRIAEQAAQSAERLRSLERMAAGVTHDLNNLMMVVSAASTSLAVEVGASPNAQRELMLVDAAITQARAMSGRLLDFCRGRPRARTMVPLRDVVRGTTFLVGNALAPKVRVTLDVAPDGELIASGTAVEVEQVLLNLLQNAADAMPEGGEVTVTLAETTVDVATPAAYSIIEPGRYALIAVRDAGVGMSFETMGHIFEPFFTTRRDEGGSGLGLATVLGTAHDLGGHVLVRSTPGTGSEFFVYLPLASEATATPTPPLRPKPVTALPQRMLLVDDDAAVRRAVSRMLARLGVSVIEVSDAEEALLTLARAELEIEAVLSDVMMPGMSGIELFEQARANGFRGPMLLMTGYSDMDLPDRFSEDGMGRVLTKPFSAADLNESFAMCAL